ncbi:MULTISPECIES: sulfatase [unclassified Lentimonas]|uniref:sulfatase family protein n=1 Tax=unclassified Lentimonas TaxID=2630993 RepID=UPI001389AB26|nr:MULTISPECIES: sulfatase [unclassified Lentimonas]
MIIRICMFLMLAIVASAEVKPNIIFLLADDQNFGSIGIYGNPEVQTPNMDKLGHDGLIFDKHYNTTAICMASRATAFTGMYEYKTGTNFQHSHMRPEIWAKSYPVLLREAGYLTAFAGKFGLDVYGLGPKGKQGMPEGDFDIWGGAPGQSEYATKKNASMAKYAQEYPHSTLSYGAFGCDVIREAAELKKPFCLSISFKAPHRPATPDPQFDHIYAGKTFTKPANYGREHSEHLSPQSKTGRQYVRFEQWGYDTDYDAVMATYYQQIYAIDVALGMIRDELEAQGMADNTVIIYTSDNGFLCGAHGYGSKVLPLEESARAPLMVYDPRSGNAGKGLRTTALTGNIDFAPTILDLAGVPVPENMDGESLLSVLEEPTASHHQQLAFMNLYGDVPTKNLTVLTEEVKYTYWWYGDATMEPTEELFQLKKDPLELTNLAKNPEAEPLLQKMRKKYDEELELWKEQAEDAYTQYVPLFDRTIPWEQKEFKNTKGNTK